MEENGRGDRLRVLDLTDELAFQGARLLVGLGADVVRVERPADAELPRADDLHWHAGKRLVRLPEGGAGEARLDELAAQADVVIESGPRGGLRGLTVTGEEPRSRWEGSVHAVVTPFGLTGPWRDREAGDLVAAAAGGMAWLGGKPGLPPKAPPREQAAQLAGAHLAIAALLGVIARDRTGRGQLIDVSAQEAVAATLETAAIAWIHAGRHPSRNGGVYEHVAHRVFAAADGHVAGGYSGSDRMWTDLLAWMAEHGEAADLTDAKWADPVLRWQGREHVDRIVAGFAARRTRTELAREGRRRALPWAEVSTAARLTANEQLAARDFFTRVHGPDLPEEGVLDVGFPFPAPGLPRPVRLAAPDRADPAAPWRTGSPRGRRPSRPTVGPARRVLDGVRVLDLTWVLAGPYATKTLAEHGADVIKIESRHRQDPTRFAPSMRLRPDAGFDDSGYFLNYNRNKRSVALNLRTQEGLGILRRLVARCDIVVENFSPGVLARWELGYDRMAEINPGVILVSMAGVGQSGPWRDAVTFADTLAAMSGLTSETADPGEAPQGLTFGLGDMVAANAAVLATLDLVAAGRGGHVDLSQLEAMAATMGPAVLQARLPADLPADRRTAAQPNRHPRMVPHGVYPTRGEDRWLALAVRDEEQWRRLARRAGLDDLESAGPQDRLREEDRIDAALAAWCARQDGADLAADLQSLGIAAAVVATGQDLVEHDPHLAERGFYPVLEHPIAGAVRHEGIVVRLSETPGALVTAAPLLGEHTDAVLGDLLGMAEAELAPLREAGVLE